MATFESEPLEPRDDADAVGILLAEAFSARVRRFSPPARTRLLAACRLHLLQNDPETSRLLFEGDALKKGDAPREGGALKHPTDETFALNHPLSDR